MVYRNATIEDIPAIMQLQKKYHIATISENDIYHIFCSP